MNDYVLTFFAGTFVFIANWVWAFYRVSARLNANKMPGQSFFDGVILHLVASLFTVPVYIFFLFWILIKL